MQQSSHAAAASPPVNPFDLSTAPLGSSVLEMVAPPVVTPPPANPAAPVFQDAPRYATTPPQKPQIDERTANFNVHVAGLDAAAQAAKMGCPPEAAAALLDAALGAPLEVEGIILTPLSPQTALLFEYIELFGQEGVFPLRGTIMANRAMAYISAKPVEAWQLIRVGNGQGFLDAVIAATGHLSIPGAKKIAAWITAEMKRLAGEADEAGLGKPPMGEGWEPPANLLPAPPLPNSRPNPAAQPAGLRAL